MAQRVFRADYFPRRVVTGVALTLIAEPGLLMAPPPPPEVAGERMVRHMEHSLDLSADQVARIGPHLEKHLKALHDLRMAVRPKILDQLRLMDREVSSQLNEDKKQLWRHHFRQIQRDLQRPGAPAPGP